MTGSPFIAGRRMTKPLLTLVTPLLLGIAMTAQSRPVGLEETQRLTAPRTGLTFLGESVAIEGDWALATALYSEDGSYNYPYRQLALLYQRSGNEWVFNRVLVDDPTDENSWNEPKVAMSGTLAAVSTSPLRMFRRTLEGNWVTLTQPFPGAPGNQAWANGRVRIDGTTIAAIAGRCTHSVVSTDLVVKDWTEPQLLSGNTRICELANTGGTLALDGNRLAFTNPQEDSSHPPNQVRLYRRGAPADAWQPDGTLPDGDYGVGLALHADELFVGSWDPQGNLVYRRDQTGWTTAGRLPTLRAFSPNYNPAWRISADGEYVATTTSTFDGLPMGIALYRKDSQGAYQHVAQLASSQGDALGPAVEISGRTVIVAGWNLDSPDQGSLHFFELPDDLSAPRLLQDDFEDGDATGWTVASGVLSVTRRGPSRVLRQSNTSGTALALLAASLMGSQSVQADLRPITFAAGDRWVGLVTRYTDSSNYYYAVLRSGGFLTLRRLQDGRHVTLANRAVPVRAGGRYRLRLESIGSRHRVYVNDRRLIDVYDDRLGPGRAGVLSQGASVDFDNVVVTPYHRTPLYEAEIANGIACEDFVSQRLLRQSGAPEWDCTDYEAGYLRQASVTSVARAAIGPSTADQAVESRLQLEAFANDGGEEQWIGVMTRYTNEENFYFFSLRSSKGMSLGKFVDGQRVELGRAGFTLGVSDWHVFRLDAIGNRLRAYIDGQLLLEAVDDSHPSGVSGIVTDRASARFDYLRVVQP